MIQLRTFLFIVDKSSAVQGICIKVLGNKFVAQMGDTFLLSLRHRSARRLRFLK